MRRTLLAVGFMLMAEAASANDCIPSKPVAFDVFMDHGLSRSVPLTLRVPDRYEHADIGNDGRVYWMPPDVVVRVRESSDLPVDTGFMYGKVSLDVGYDSGRKAFIGVGDVEENLRAAGLELAGTEERQAGGHRLLFIEAIEPASKKSIYGVYIAIGLDTNVVYVAWRPPANDRAVGDCFWKDFKSTLISID